MSGLIGQLPSGRERAVGLPNFTGAEQRLGPANRGGGGQDRRGRLGDRPVVARADGPTAGSLDLQAVVGGLRRQKAIILTTVAVVTLGSALATLLIEPRYTATATLLIEPGETRVLDVASVAGGLPGWLRGDASAVATQVELLRSRTHARQVVESLDLAADPEFAQGETRVQRLARDWLPASWLIATGVADASDGSVAIGDPELAAREREQAVAVATERLRERLTVGQSGQSDVIAVSATAADPDKAARITNAVVDLYIASQLAAKVEATTRAGDWVDQRLEQLRHGVLEAETAIESYRSAHDLMTTRDGSLDGQELAGLNAALLEVRAERMAVETRLAEVGRVLGDGASARSLTEVASSPIMVDLRRQETELQRERAQLAREYGDRHPVMVRIRAEQADIAARIEQETANVIGSLEHEVAVARQREEALQASVQAAKGASAQARGAAVQLRQLEREAEAKGALYEIFLARSKEIEEQQDLLLPDARVISAAAVSADRFPSLAVMTTVGLVASLVLGTALAALREHLDHGLRTGRQVEQALGVPSLGLVPKLDRRQAPHRYLLDKPLSIYAEAVRGIHTCLQLARDDVRPHVVLVTSTLPGEGKTTLALSLGASMARSGQRVLVIDLDLRHPSLAERLDRSVEADLIDLLADRSTLDDTVLIDPDEARLHVLPVKGRETGPSQPVGFQELQSLIARLSLSYDCILLDAGPVAVTDTKIAALLADAVLVVVRWDRTDASTAAEGIDALREIRTPIAGVVLTQVDLRRHARYGYGDLGQYYGKHANSFVN